VGILCESNTVPDAPGFNGAVLNSLGQETRSRVGFYRVLCTSPDGAGSVFGAGGENRTPDPLITNHLLALPSGTGIFCALSTVSYFQAFAGAKTTVGYW
jgi:hypothetical protein